MRENGFILIFLSLLSSISLGQKAITLGEQERAVFSDSQIFHFKDTSNELNRWQLNDRLFKKGIPNQNHEIGFSHWIRFNIKNLSPSESWTLELFDPHISNVELYKEDQLIGSPTGFSKRFDSKYYKHKNFIFDLNPAKNKETTYYIRLKSKFHSDFRFQIKTHKAFSNYALDEYFILGMFYGILAILAVYNLFLYFSIRESTYLYYVAYIITAALHTFSEDGLGFQYLWPSFPTLNSAVDLLSFLLLLISFLLYSNSFLEFGSRLPKLRKWTIIATCVYIVYFIYVHFIGSWNVFIYIVYLIPYSITYVGAIKIYKQGVKQARFFVVGFSVILISFVVFFLRLNFNLEGALMMVYIFNFGFILEAIMLSYALGDKIKITKEISEQAQKNVIRELEINEKLKDKVNAELEQKVQERTTELEYKTNELTEANEELGALRDKLYEMNSELDKTNWQLQKEVKKVTRSKILSETVPYPDFSKIFPDNITCLKHLETLKWTNGFKCKKCGHLNYTKMAKPFLRKCSSCKHPESVTANTLFHAVKFPLNKAFYIAYLVCDNQKKLTVDELSELLELRRNTAWGFKKKVESRIEELKDKGLYTLGDSWEKLII